MKAGDVPNGCGRYFVYKKINNYVDSLEIAESFIYSKFVKILFPVENQYFDKILERLTANP